MTAIQQVSIVQTYILQLKPVLESHSREVSWFQLYKLTSFN